MIKDKDNIIAIFNKWKDTGIIRNYHNNIKDKLDRFDRIWGTPFSIQSLGFTNALATVYPIVVIFLFWVITGNNVSNIQGFSSGNFFEGKTFGWKFLNYYAVIRYTVLFGFALLIGIFTYMGRKETRREPTFLGISLPLDMDNQFPTYSFREKVAHYTFCGGIEQISFMIASFLLLFAQGYILFAILLFLVLQVIWLRGLDYTDNSLGVFIVAGVAHIIIALSIYQIITEKHAISFWLYKYAILNASYAIANILKIIIYYSLTDRFIRNGFIRGLVTGVLLLIIAGILLFSISNPDTTMLNASIIIFVSFIFLPVINSLFDYLSLNVTRICIRKSIQEMTVCKSLVYFLIDIIVAIICLSCLFVFFWFGYFLMNIISSAVMEFYKVIDIANIVRTYKDNIWDINVLWIYIILFTTFIPTLLHIIIYVTTVFIALPNKIFRKRYEKNREKIEYLIGLLQNLDEEKIKEHSQEINTARFDILFSRCAAYFLAVIVCGGTVFVGFIFALNFAIVFLETLPFLKNLFILYI